MKNLFTLFALFISIFSMAQITKGGGGAFSFGMQTLDTKSLTAFSENDFSLNSSNFSFGGYGYGQIDAWVIGFSGAGI